MKILGIDIGGTGIKGAIVNTKKGELITERHRIPTPDPATPGAMLDVIVSLVQKFEWDGPIGCGFPAVVRNHVVQTASNIDKSWIGINAGQKIEEATGCKTFLVNDVDAAGMAEMKFGAGKDRKGVTIMIAAGTGLGSALFIDDRLVPNTELGFIQVSGMAGEHYTANSVRKNEDLNWEEWGSRLNEYFHRLEFLFWPDLFILGGGVSKNFDDYRQYLHLNTEIVPAETKNHAGIIGAALAARLALK